MYIKSEFILITISFVCIVKSNDIRLGYASPHSIKIYSEIAEANPAIWRRTNDIDIHAPNNEVISAIYVTDLREDKDGEANIVSGGVGTEGVTLQLKSPTILRGYKFDVEVFAEIPNLRFHTKGSSPIYDEGQFARKF